MAIKIETRQYEATAMKAPKGAGCWAFHRDASHGIDAINYFTPYIMTFTEAKVWVKRVVRAEGFQDATVHVMP